MNPAAAEAAQEARAGRAAGRPARGTGPQTTWLGRRRKGRWGP